MSRRKIVEVNSSRLFKECHHDGHYSVIYDDDKQNNRYIVYRHGHRLTPSGLKESKRQIARYADFDSCMWLLWQLTSNQMAVPAPERRSIWNLDTE